MTPARPRRDIALAVSLYVVALAVNIASVVAAGRSQVLMGEEMSVSIRDVLFSVEEHAQASIWSTNFGAPVYYWLASHLDPSYSLFSARRWKAAAMALLAPLVYLVLVRRLHCRRRVAVFGGITVALLPGVAMFAWLATENGLETVIGVAGLYVATSQRRWWPVAPVAAGLAVTTYTSGIAWAAVIGAVCIWRAFASAQRLRALLAVGAACVVGAGVVAFPLLWWVVGPHRLVAGGGTVDAEPVENAENLVRLLALSGRSYYFFGDQAALGSPVLAVVTVLCAVVAARRRETWPWLAVAVVTVLLWLPAGNEPGVRRTVALAVVAALVLAVAADVALAARRRFVVALAAVGVIAVLAPLAVTQVSWVRSYATGAQSLAADFPIAPGPMPPTFAAWDSELRNGTMTVDDMVTQHDGLRTLAVVWMLADRQGRGTVGLPAPEEFIERTVPGA